MSADGEKCAAGRPAELDEVKRAEICALVSSGCSYRTAAKYVGCSVQAISALAKRDGEFAEQLEKAVAQREAILLSHLRESSKRSWRAAVWLLEMTVGGRFGGSVSTLDEEAESEMLDEAVGRMRATMGAGAGSAEVRSARAEIPESGVGDGARKVDAKSIRESMAALERSWARGKAAEGEEG